MSISENLIQECIDASNAVSACDPDLGIFFTPGGTFTLLNTSTLDSIDLQCESDGFFAAAYVDSSNNIIITYEGSDLNPLDQTSFANGSRAADFALATGGNPKALSDAAKFAHEVQLEAALSPGLANDLIYVTGHSLGGTEAEAAANAYGFISGSVTFGATGLPAYVSAGGNDNFLNFVDYGDPVGNYARDSLSELSDLSLTGSHLGTVIKVGSSWSQYALEAAALVELASPLKALPAFLAVEAIQAASHHFLSDYETDLQNLYPTFDQLSTPVQVSGTPTSPSSGSRTTPNDAFLLANLVASNSGPSNSNPHPLITGPSSISANTGAVVPLATIVVASETSSNAGHIDHYTAFVVSGSGSLIVNNQSYSLGNPVSNITPAQFATALFSAGNNPGLTEIAVVAFDNLGNSSITAETTISVTASNTAPQPIISTDHTPPTIVPPSQQLVTGVGSNPNLTSAYLEVTDANSAQFTLSQLTYTITSAPSDGYLIKGGSIVSSFTQADVNNGLIEYQENGTVASNDSFTYFVSDPAGNRTTNTTFNISINAPATSTHPTISANSALSVGQGQTALITDSNLYVTDTGLNPWQIIYTITSSPAHGQILADGVNVVTYFTQQQVDLGLISYQNTGNVSGPDNLSFTVSDGAGGNISQTGFGINVIPKNNLSVDVERPLYEDPEGNYTPPVGIYTPSDVAVVSTQILSATDPGVDPSDIVYTITSLPPGNTFFLIGQFGPGSAFTGYSSFSGRSFGQSDINNGFPHSFTQAELANGQVYFRDIAGGGINFGQQLAITFSVSDNVGNSISNLAVPLVIEPSGVLSAGVFTTYGNIAQTYLTAPIGQITNLGSGLLTYVTPQSQSSQAIYHVFFLPSHGTLLLDGQSVAIGADLTQQEVDQGRLSYSEDGSLVASDQFGFMLHDPFHTGGSPVYVNVTMTGTEGGLVLSGSSGFETLSPGTGSNHLFGDGSTSVTYANSPNGVVVDLVHGTVSNGYGGTDTVSNVHSFIGSSSGTNTVNYDGRRTDYSYQELSSGWLQVTDRRSGSPDGVHQFQNIQVFDFSDGPDTENKLLRVPENFVGNATSDVLWINPTNQTVGDWLMSNGTPTWQVVGQGSSTVSIEGVGDFNGDGTADVLWENPTNGIVGDWLMNNNQPAWQQIGQGSTTMSIAGVGDFNGDGTSDILWQNPTNNLVGEWQMNNNTTTWQLVAQGSTTMNIAGIGDFNGDGKSDILWENPTNNLVGMWGMNGSTPTWSLISQGSTTMNIVGVGDFTGNGTDDVLWENPSNGTVGFWGMNNGQATLWNVVATANTSYQVAGIGDYYGNGTDDIMWRNASTGDTGIWQMNNGQATWHDLGIASTTVNPVKA